MRSVRWPMIGLLAAISAAWGVLCAGCELSGEYEDDNVTVQFGNTNGTAQVEAE